MVNGEAVSESTTPPSPKTPSKSKPVDELDIGECIGKGAYAKVHRSKWSLTAGTKVVAVKIIQKANAPRDYLERFLPREMKIVQKLEHPNVVKVYKVFEIDMKVYFIMELMEGGDLLDHINSRGYVREPQAWKFFSQAVDAVSYIHSQKIIHRDLKCENLLLDKNQNIKLSDFGFSTTCPEKNLLNTFCGSCAYASPEILYGLRYDGYASDTWSLGVVLYAMVCGTLPFDDSDMKTLMLQIKTKLRFPKRVNFACRDLIRGILALKKDERLALWQVRSHPWMASSPKVSALPKGPNGLTSSSSEAKDPVAFPTRAASMSMKAPLAGQNSAPLPEVTVSRSPEPTRARRQQTSAAITDLPVHVDISAKPSSRSQPTPTAYGGRRSTIDQGELHLSARDARGRVSVLKGQQHTVNTAPSAEQSEQKTSKSPALELNGSGEEDFTFYRSSTMSANPAPEMRRGTSWRQRFRLPWKSRKETK